MYRHQRARKAATITFTSDFHELLTGELTRGDSVMVRYDPLRMWPETKAAAEALKKGRVTLHYKSAQYGPERQFVLESRAGLAAQYDADPTGQGFVLTGVIEVSPSAEELILWFSAKAPDGQVLWDTDYGKNFHFRFADEGIQILEAAIGSQPGRATSSFRVSVAAPTESESVQVRYRVLYPAGSDEEFTIGLDASGKQAPGGGEIWSKSDVAVPYHATLAFDVLYFIHGRRYKDDNDGSYFIAPIPAESQVKQG